MDRIIMINKITEKPVKILYFESKIETTEFLSDLLSDWMQKVPCKSIFLQRRCGNGWKNVVSYHFFKEKGYYYVYDEHTLETWYIYEN